MRRKIDEGMFLGRGVMGNKFAFLEYDATSKKFAWGVSAGAGGNCTVYEIENSGEEWRSSAVEGAQCSVVDDSNWSPRDDGTNPGGEI